MYFPVNYLYKISHEKVIYKHISNEPKCINKDKLENLLKINWFLVN